MIKAEIKFAALIVFLLMATSYVEVANGQLCAVNCGNGYCCPASHPVCIQGLPLCCPTGTLFFYNGYCYKSAGRFGIDNIKVNATEAARTLI